MISNNIHLEGTTKQSVAPKVLYPEFIPIAPRSTFNTVESNFIDKIRSIPLFEGMDVQSVSTLSNDIYQMRELMKGFQKKDNIKEFMGVIHNIHETFATKLIPIDATPYKGVTNVRNWMKFLTNIHPIIDSSLKDSLDQLPLLKMCFFKDTSEIMGHNVILDTSDTTNVDITLWKETSELFDNSISKLPKVWSAPSHIRETVRHKLDNSVVRLVQSANARLSGDLARNTVSEAFYATDPLGGISRVPRPLPLVPIAHGLSLVSDTYQREIRILAMSVDAAYKDALSYLSQYYNFGDFLVHIIVNHLFPMGLYMEADCSIIKYQTPTGVEETFSPATYNLSLLTDHRGNRIDIQEAEINNNVIKPVVIQGE